MGRFQAFGNLFAHANGVGHRLDRHPTMSMHPTTPMHEADLGRHLASQTSLRVGLVDFVAMKRGRADEVLAQEIGRDAAIVSIDVLDAETLREAGRLIWEPRLGAPVRRRIAGRRAGARRVLARRGIAAVDVDRSRLCAGGPHRGRIGLGVADHSRADPPRVEPGFELIELDATLAVDEEQAAPEVVRATAAALAAVQRGRDPLIFTAAGPDDPRVAAFRAAIHASGVPIARVNDRLGAALGDILNAACPADRSATRRDLRRRHLEPRGVAPRHRGAHRDRADCAGSATVPRPLHRRRDRRRGDRVEGWPRRRA